MLVCDVFYFFLPKCCAYQKDMLPLHTVGYMVAIVYIRIVINF